VVKIAQYIVGTIDVTSGSQTVIGNDTAWSGLSTPAFLKLDFDGSAIYEIVTFVSDTELTLSANYAGEDAEEESYQIVSDFSPNYDFYLPYQGDRDAGDWLRKVIIDIDATLKSLDDRITALEP
jgi:hypothetical protein